MLENTLNSEGHIFPLNKGKKVPLDVVNSCYY